MGLWNYLQQLEDRWNNATDTGVTFEDLARRQQSGVDQMSNQFNQMAGGRLFEGTMQGGVRMPPVQQPPVPIPQQPQQLPPEILEALMRQQQMSMAAAQGAGPNAIRDQSSFFDPQNNPYAALSPDKPGSTQPPWTQEMISQDFFSQQPPVTEAPPLPQAGPFGQADTPGGVPQQSNQFSPLPDIPPRDPNSPFWQASSINDLTMPTGQPSPETAGQARMAVGLGEADYELSRQGQLDRQRTEMGDRNKAGLQLANSRFEPTPPEQRYQEMMASDQTSQQRGTAFSRNPEMLAEFHKATATMDQQRQEEEAVAHQAWKDTFDQGRADKLMGVVKKKKKRRASGKLQDDVIPWSPADPEAYAGAQGTRDARQEELRMRGKRKGANLTARQRGVPLPSADTVARNDRIDRGVATMSDYAMADVPPEQMEIIQNENPQFRRDQMMKELFANPGIMAGGASLEDLMSLIDGGGGGDPELELEPAPPGPRGVGVAATRALDWITEGPSRQIAGLIDILGGTPKPSPQGMSPEGYTQLFAAVTAGNPEAQQIIRRMADGGDAKAIEFLNLQNR